MAAARFSGGPRSAPRSEASILEDCWQRLESAPDLDPGQIELQVEAGCVRMSGSVASRFAKLRAEDLCAAVRDVTDVYNRLRVREPGT